MALPPASRIVPDEVYGETVAALPSLQGKVYAITGTTSGTGYWTAVAAVRRGAACVMLLNRPSARADEALQAIKREAAAAAGSSSSSAVVHVDCDLTSFASVDAAAAAVRAESAANYGGALDALVCNAGVMAAPDVRTADGFDLQMQTNHLSHCLLLWWLLPLLEAAAAADDDHGRDARVVFHSSGARKPNKMRPGSDDLEARFFARCGAGSLGGDGLGACFLRYHQTKLANS